MLPSASFRDQRNIHPPPGTFLSELGFISISVFSPAGFVLRLIARCPWCRHAGFKILDFPPFFLPHSHHLTCFLLLHWYLQGAADSSTSFPWVFSPFGPLRSILRPLSTLSFLPPLRTLLESMQNTYMTLSAFSALLSLCYFPCGWLPGILEFLHSRIVSISSQFIHVPFKPACIILVLSINTSTPPQTLFSITLAARCFLLSCIGFVSGRGEGYVCDNCLFTTQGHSWVEKFEERIYTGRSLIPSGHGSPVMWFSLIYFSSHCH